MATLVSLDRKFIFVHVPKTGGISLTSSIVLDAPQHVLNRKAIRSVFQAIRVTGVFDPFRFTAPLMLPEHANLAYVQKAYALDPQEFFVFGAVRNPWQREVSNYFYLTRHMRSRLIKKTYWRYRNMNFKEFLQSRFADWEKGRLTQQVDYFKDKEGKIMLSDFCRVENLSMDYARIASVLNLKKKEIPHLNRSVKGDLAEYYDDENINIIATIYRDDIDYFGYDYKAAA